MMVQNPLNTFLDQQQRVLIQGCRATNNYSYTLFSKGMTGRLGTESNPSAPLLFRHVLYMDQVFNTNSSMPQPRRLDADGPSLA
jgi:hypothetical protein